MGWLAVTQGQAQKRRFAPDLLEDPVVRRINRSFPWIALGGFALPAALGYALTGTLTVALTGLLWGGLVRIFLIHHVTWSVNSICHTFGKRAVRAPSDRAATTGSSACWRFGEGWHNNHHAFPRSAFHGLRWWQFDPSALLIRGLEKLGLARNVITISPERQEVRQREGLKRARIDADAPVDRAA